MNMSENNTTLLEVLILFGDSQGKPRDDVTEGDMRTSRLRFKYTLRQCQNNDEIMRADALARSLNCLILERSQKCPL